MLMLMDVCGESGLDAVASAINVSLMHRPTARRRPTAAAADGCCSLKVEASVSRGLPPPPGAASVPVFACKSNAPWTRLLRYAADNEHGGYKSAALPNKFNTIF